MIDDVPPPVVVADLLLHPVRDGGEDPAPQDEPLLVDRASLDATDMIVVPVDGALDRSVSTENEAVALEVPEFRLSPRRMKRLILSFLTTT